MKTLTLIRVSDTGSGTYGVLLDGLLPFAVTLEKPWKDNKKGESCIPVGTYRALRCSKSPDYGFKDSPKFGDTFQVFGVPGRGNILFHKGNVPDDTHGCIEVAEMFDKVGLMDGVAASAKGFTEFLHRLQGEAQFIFIVKAAF